MLRRVVILSLLLVVALAVVPAGAAAASGHGRDPLSRINHIVVIYQENHSFDNLYGGWEKVNGLQRPRRRTTQVNQAGTPYDCLLQNDVNLTSPPLSVRCTDTTTGTTFTSHFRNRPFTIDDYIPRKPPPARGPGCPPPTGCRTAAGCPAAALATWCTASTRSSTSSTTDARTAM